MDYHFRLTSKTPKEQKPNNLFSRKKNFNGFLITPAHMSIKSKQESEKDCILSQIKSLEKLQNKQ